MSGKRKNTKAAPVVAKTERANYGANERPRCCANARCGSANSRIAGEDKRHSPTRTIRRRVCLECGKRWKTRDCIQRNNHPESEKAATV